MAKILVVDDNEQDRYMAKVLFESQHHDVRVATNGAEALDIARRFAPELLVTDILMPDMDGFALAQSWSRDETLRTVPIIVYTATYTDAKDEELALHLGAARFVQKPCEPSKMLRIVDEVLRPGAAAGRTRTPPEVIDEGPFLRQYNSALVRKLERKVLQLEMTQACVDQAAMPILWIDGSGVVCYANAAAEASIGASAGPVVGARLEHIQETWTTQAWAEEIWPALRQGRAKAVELRVRSPTGGTFDAEVTCHYWERADQAHAALFINDVSERRALEVQVRQAQRLEAIGLVASSVAHDFNNLLSAIQGFVDIAQHKLGADSAAAGELEGIAGVLSRAAQLTGQLLAFGREQPLRPTRLALNDVVREFQGLLRHALGERVTLTLELDPDVGEIEADRGQLERVLMNLGLNARDAMPHGGALTIQTLREPRGVRLSVIDTGQGMDRDTVERIFEPFFSTKAPGKGTGLGMTTVLSVIQRMGGSVGVRSTPGAGTRVDLALPVDSAGAGASQGTARS